MKIAPVGKTARCPVHHFRHMASAHRARSHAWCQKADLENLRPALGSRGKLPASRRASHRRCGHRGDGMMRCANTAPSTGNASCSCSSAAAAPQLRAQSGRQAASAVPIARGGCHRPPVGEIDDLPLPVVDPDADRHATLAISDSQ